MNTFARLADLQALVGGPLGTSEWITIEQARIDRFAAATDDHQWIHTDSARAAAGPYGATIAHGFLTLSLLPAFLETAFAVADTRMGLNYGLNRVRFTAPVPVGSRLRALRAARLRAARRRCAAPHAGHRGARRRRAAGLRGRVAEPALPLTRSPQERQRANGAAAPALRYHRAHSPESRCDESAADRRPSADSFCPQVGDPGPG